MFESLYYAHLMYMWLVIFESSFRNNGGDRYVNVRQPWKAALCCTLFIALLGDYLIEVWLFNGPESAQMKATLTFMSHVSSSLVLPLLLAVSVILLFYAYIGHRSWIAMTNSHKIISMLLRYFALLQIAYLVSTRFNMNGDFGRRVLLNTLMSNAHTIGLGILFSLPSSVKQPNAVVDVSGGIEISNSIEHVNRSHNDADV